MSRKPKSSDFVPSNNRVEVDFSLVTFRNFHCGYRIACANELKRSTHAFVVVVVDVVLFSCMSHEIRIARQNRTLDINIHHLFHNFLPLYGDKNVIIELF